MEREQVIYVIAYFVAVLTIASAYEDKGAESPLYDSEEVDNHLPIEYTEAFDLEYDEEGYPLFEYDLDDPDLPWLDDTNGSDDVDDEWEEAEAPKPQEEPPRECSEKDVIMSPMSKGEVRKTNWFPLWGAKDRVWHVKVTNNCPGHDLLVLKVVVNFLHVVPTTDPKFLRGLRGCVKGSSDTQFFCTLDTERLQHKGEKKSTKWISYPREANAKDPPLSLAVQAPSWMRTAAVFEGQKYGSADATPKA